ncbi:hypothetical protein ACE6H2_008285 [Prunus campanulata]
MTNPTQALTQPQLLQTITSLLTAAKTPQLQPLKPYIPYLTQPLLLSILRSKALANKPSTLLSFFQWAQAHNPSLTQTPHPLLALLHPLLCHHKYPDAKTQLVQFIAADRQNELLWVLLHPDDTVAKPSKALLDISIGAYLHCGKPLLAAQLFKRMKRRRLQPNLLTCNTLLYALVRHASCDSISLAKSVFKDAIKLGVSVTTNTFNILIYGYCLEHKFRDAVELLSRMSEFGCWPDNVSYNTILDWLCKKGQLVEARDLLLDMKNRGLFPNRNTYNILVCGYCKMGWLKEAMQIIELMTQNNSLPDIWTYNMLIRALCKEGRIEDAVRLRDEMGHLKLMPDVVTYNTLIDGYFEWRSSSEALTLIEEMREKGVKPNAVTHNIMMKWFCKEGKMDEASDTRRKMEEDGFAPNCVTYNTLINGYCKAGKMEEAFKMMDEMGRKGLKTNIVTLNTVLHTLCKEKKLDEAFELLHTTMKRGYILDEISYGTLIMGCFKNEKADKALKLWDEMKEKQAFDLLSDMEAKKLAPDHYTYGAILGALNDIGRIEEAEEFLLKLIESRKLPDQSSNLLQKGVTSEFKVEFDSSTVAYSEQINELCFQDKYKDAMRILEESMQKGITLNKDVYINLMNGLIRGKGVHKGC